MVWTRGMPRDFDGWAKSGAKGWSFADVLPVFKKQEDWEGGANAWRGVGGPVHIRRPKDPNFTAPAFIEAARDLLRPTQARYFTIRVEIPILRRPLAVSPQAEEYMTPFPTLVVGPFVDQLRQDFWPAGACKTPARL
jgi:choline dehydrogenase-like flavoprotein